MADLKVRGLTDEVHRALRERAAAHGRSVAAEVRVILEAAVRPVAPVKLGSMLTAIGREFGGVDLDVMRDPALMGAGYECGLGANASAE